jgi:hypothetical protein
MLARGLQEFTMNSWHCELKNYGVSSSLRNTTVMLFLYHNSEHRQCNNFNSYNR